MSNKDYLNDIAQIKNLMTKSSRFISLSGTSGILAGIYAIIGAAIAYLYLFPAYGEALTLYSWNFKMFIILLSSVAALSVITAYLLTHKKAKKNEEAIWDETTKRLLINFLIPMITGGVYIIIKLSSQHYGLTASLMLIFYGLSLVNAAKYTLGYIRFLGYAEIVTGLICAAIPGYGFWFWVLGFGLYHIVYGVIMYYYDKKS